jgi:hypothetical protein
LSDDDVHPVFWLDGPNEVSSAAVAGPSLATVLVLGWFGVAKARRANRDRRR